MLRIQSNSASPTCDGISRRSFLRIGALGLSALGLKTLTLPELIAAQADGSGYVKDKAVIFLFLAGGPSQHETFDPKPDGPDTSTSLAGHIPTALPGVRFASYFPKMAKLADRLSIVRSFHTHHAEHDGAYKQILTADTTIPDGKPIKNPGMGAVYARVAGAAHPITGMPRHALIPPTLDHTGTRSAFAGSFEALGEGSQPAYLGASYSPFEVKVPMAEGQPKAAKSKRGEPQETRRTLLDDLEPTLPDIHLNDRLDLLRQMDRLDRRIDAGGIMANADAQTARALEVLRGGEVRKALDLSREDPRVLAAYDTEHFRNYRCGDDSKFDRKGPSIGVSLGRQLLMARRLCEAGAGFVTVVHSNWDFHARKGVPNMPEGMGVLAPPLDHAVAAFLEDIRARGLDEKILLVITGEFGRTPTIDKNMGRHHWPRICPLVFAGGGLNHGQVIGQSDRRGGEPADNPYSIDDLHATIMHAMFDVGRMRLDTGLPAIVQERASRGRPIAELF